SIVRVPRADWADGRWQVTDAVEYPMDGHTVAATPLPANGLHIAETLDDFLEVQREPEELSYAALRDRINSLARKGIDASHYLVDLHLKLALPFASCVLAVVAVPIAGRLRRHPSIAAIVGL